MNRLEVTCSASSRQARRPHLLFAELPRQSNRPAAWASIV